MWHPQEYLSCGCVTSPRVPQLWLCDIPKSTSVVAVWHPQEYLSCGYVTYDITPWASYLSICIHMKVTQDNCGVYDKMDKVFFFKWILTSPLRREQTAMCEPWDIEDTNWNPDSWIICSLSLAENLLTHFRRLFFMWANHFRWATRICICARTLPLAWAIAHIQMPVFGTCDSQSTHPHTYTTTTVSHS